MRRLRPDFGMPSACPATAKPRDAQPAGPRIEIVEVLHSTPTRSSLRPVRPWGLIILDKMLRRGRVANPNEEDADTVALRKLNTRIAGDDRVHSVLLPVGSGMTLGRRRQIQSLQGRSMSRWVTIATSPSSGSKEQRTNVFISHEDRAVSAPPWAAVGDGGLTDFTTRRSACREAGRP